MTNDTGSTSQGSGKDPVAGKGQSRSEGESIAPDHAAAPAKTSGSETGGDTVPAPAAGGPEGGSAGDGTQDEPETPQDEGTNDSEEEPEDEEEQEAAEDAEGDDPPDAEVVEIAKRVAIAEAAKATQVPTVDLFSTAPDKKKARDTLAEDYAKALAPGGELRLKFDKANERFVRAASDMAGILDAWIKRAITDDKAKLGVFLAQRDQVGRRLRARAGLREGRRAKTQETAKVWADAFAAWSSPVPKMLAQIAEYADKIDKLNADINNEVNRDQAIFVFWFEIAPRHLQLRTTPLEAEIAKEVAALSEALDAVDPALARRLRSGRDRGDGSLYLIPPKHLEAHRKWVLRRWTTAAERAGDAEAEFKIRPDDAGALRQRWDKLKGDAWIKDAAALLDDPAARP